MKHFRDIERLAVVGETKWEAGMAAFCKPFTSATIKYFDHTKAAEAKTWLERSLPVAALNSPTSNRPLCQWSAACRRTLQRIVDHANRVGVPLFGDLLQTSCPRARSSRTSGDLGGLIPVPTVTRSGSQWWCIRGAQSTAVETSSPKSRTFNSTHNIVLGIVRPPGEPVTGSRRPSRDTIVGDCELSMRLPGAIVLAGVPIGRCRCV